MLQVRVELSCLGGLGDDIEHGHVVVALTGFTREGWDADSSDACNFVRSGISRSCPMNEGQDCNLSVFLEEGNYDTWIPEKPSGEIIAGEGSALEWNPVGTKLSN